MVMPSRRDNKIAVFLGRRRPKIGLSLSVLCVSCGHSVPERVPIDAVKSVHPNEQTLRCFELGKLDEAAGESVQKHLEGCDE